MLNYTSINRILHQDTFTIGIVAGEASGDLLGYHLIKGLTELYPNVNFRFVGIAGTKMQSLGAKSLYPMEMLSVRGYVEVLKSYRKIIKMREELIEYYLKNPPDLFIGIDAPDFNLDLEKPLKQIKVPVVHYVSPSIWAWRRERISKIEQSVDEIFALFPFEEECYKNTSIKVTYVGHPLADHLPLEFNKNEIREQLNLNPMGKYIAILPGSRTSELEYLSDTFIQACKLIYKENHKIQFLVPMIDEHKKNLFLQAIQRNEAGYLPIVIYHGKAHQLLMASDVSLIASGTATLEALLLKSPMVIAYKMPFISWILTKRKAYLPYVGLPNILAEEFIVPEFLQEQATPENLSLALLNLINTSHITEPLKQRFSEIHLKLKQNTSLKIAQRIGEILELNQLHLNSVK